MNDLLRKMVEVNSSDMHIKVGNSPCLRIDGELTLVDIPTLDASVTERLALSMMNEAQRKTFLDDKEIDFAYSLAGVGRFRVNVFRQRGSVGMVLRRVRSEGLNIAELSLPPVVEKLAEEPRGLILVTGTAGSGKTTTLSAIIDRINKTRRCHIVTIEDPVEVMHKDKMSIINQREIGIDTDSYADALKQVVRQDPDVIMIGEMRDMETAKAALSAAETGNLVLSSLHTIDATETMNRIIDFFPPYQQKQIRIMLASTLKGTISQRLLPRIGGGRIPAVEIMVSTSTIKEYIVNEDETYKISEAIEQGGYYGMQSFDQCLVALLKENQITFEDAVLMSSNGHDFKIKAKQAGLSIVQSADSTGQGETGTQAGSYGSNNQPWANGNAMPGRATGPQMPGNQNGPVPPRPTGYRILCSHRYSLLDTY
ncbi:MAG: type IV pilus twitching motility protein PilT [Rubrobacteridae bacterium]|nr:type IV pilus twitching motility protein PilT [Rubrobacteridae bacterium]